MLSKHVPCLTRHELAYRRKAHQLIRRVYSTASTRPLSSSTRPIAKPRATRFIAQACITVSQCRGAKRKSVVTLGDLQQGPLQSEALPPQDDAEPEYPPLLQQVRNNMLKFSHCVLVTRVGGFYEASILTI
jgi:hypothetical protein